MKIFNIMAVTTLALSTLASCNGGTCASQADTTDASMGAMECILTRSSVRNYTDQEISRDTVELLCRAGMAAPTAVDKRPWKFVVLQGEPLKAFKDSMTYRPNMMEAPLAIVICGDEEKFLEGDGRDFWIQDCSAATENVLLAAHALGLGAVWTGVYPIADRVAKVSRLLELPSSLIPLDVILFGYPAGENQPKDKWNPDNIIWK